MKISRLNLILFIIASFFLSCRRGSQTQSTQPKLLTDESCRELLQRLPERVNLRIDQPVRIRRQEDFEEEFSVLSSSQMIRFYFYKISAGGKMRGFSDGGPQESLVAVDRQSGSIHKFLQEGVNHNDFNTIAQESRLSIDLPEKAISVAELYEALTHSPGLLFVQDQSQLMTEIANYYDPKHLHEREAQKMSLRKLDVLKVTKDEKKYLPQAVSEIDGYQVFFYVMEPFAAKPKIRKKMLKIQSNGTISDVKILNEVALGESPWCTPSVFSRCEAESGTETLKH